MLSLRTEIAEGREETLRPLLRLGVMEWCELVWNDTQIVEHSKLATIEDATLEWVLAYFRNGPDRALLSIRQWFQAYRFSHGLLYFRDVIVVPHNNELQWQILWSQYDALGTGHPQQAKTLDLVAIDFYWPSLHQYIHHYVDGCDLCQYSKSTHHARYGLLQPILVAKTPWKWVSTDFIVKLPNSGGFDSIMVVVDKNSKLAHFILANETIDSNETPTFYLHHIWKHHGMLEEIICDCGCVFVSKCTKRLYKLLRIQPSLTIAFYSQSDGQTERDNQVLEQI